VSGSLVGFSLEPAGIAAIPLEGLMMGRAAFTLSQATTRLARASRIAGISATANMATEAAIQPIIFNWNEQIGVDMTWGDALMNIASVGVLSGAISGAASGIKRKATFEAEQLRAQGKISAQELIDKLAEINKVVDDATVPRPGNEPTVPRPGNEPTVPRPGNEPTVPRPDITVKQIADTLQTVRREAIKTVDDDQTVKYIRHIENELRSSNIEKAADHFEKMVAAQKRVDDPTIIPKTEQKLDTEIDDIQLETDYKSRIKDNKTFRDLEFNDNSVKEIEAIEAKEKALNLCLTGGGA